MSTRHWGECSNHCNSLIPAISQGFSAKSWPSEVPWYAWSAAPRATCCGDSCGAWRESGCSLEWSFATQAPGVVWYGHFTSMVQASCLGSIVCCQVGYGRMRGGRGARSFAVSDKYRSQHCLGRLPSSEESLLFASMICSIIIRRCRNPGQHHLLRPQWFPEPYS